MIWKQVKYFLSVTLFSINLVSISETKLSFLSPFSSHCALFHDTLELTSFFHSCVSFLKKCSFEAKLWILQRFQNIPSLYSNWNDQIQGCSQAESECFLYNTALLISCMCSLIYQHTRTSRSKRAPEYWSSRCMDTRESYLYI